MASVSKLLVKTAALCGGLGLLVACESNPLDPPEVTVSFVSPNVYYLTIAGKDDAQAPALRQRFFQEAETFARESGCLSYRVINESFTSSANINPRVTTSPNLVFGSRPAYAGAVHCELPLAPGELERAKIK